MWGLFARALDIAAAWLGGRRLQFFGRTDEADYRRSLHDSLRRRLDYEARIVPCSDIHAVHEPLPIGRGVRPSATHGLLIDRGGEIVETSFDYFARGYRGKLLIVYHHGLGEIPHDLSFRWLLQRPRGPRIPADLVCYRATGHRDYAELNHLLARLSGFQTLVGDGMMAMRAIARAYRKDYERVVCFGASLGGIVAIVEAGLSASFDLNVSLLAHLDLVEVLTATSFRRMVDRDFLVRCPVELVRAGTDGDRFLAAAQGRLAMINGIHDDWFRIQRARDTWNRFTRIRHHEIRHSHISAGGATRAVRRALLGALQDRRFVAT